MSTSHLILKRAATSRPSGKWDEDDYDVLADGDVVGRIFQVHAAPVGSPWMWTLMFGYHEDHTLDGSGVRLPSRNNHNGRRARHLRPLYQPYHRWHHRPRDWRTAGNLRDAVERQQGHISDDLLAEMHASATDVLTREAAMVAFAKSWGRE